MKNGLAFALGTMLIFPPSIVTGQSQDKPAPEGAAPAAITGSAQRAYLDPDTGRLLREPPPGAPVMTLGP